jgi:hypothetical protein
MDNPQERSSPLPWPPFALGDISKGLTQIISTAHLRAGDQCPICQAEKLDYDGMLNLACPRCGYALGGCFT